LHVIEQGAPQVEDDPLAYLGTQVPLEHTNQAGSKRCPNYTERKPVEHAQVPRRYRYVDEADEQERLQACEQRHAKDGGQHEGDTPPVRAGIATHTPQEGAANLRLVLSRVVPYVAPPTCTVVHA
jgi:hypothetical protein